mmetsp:Transcript_3034/g.6052  ORF Transcript_3034/g.6052 Transcript_3034/m.6052 type:complete len:1622 (-) Transcript_3034:66-4931(-)
MRSASGGGTGTSKAGMSPNRGSSAGPRGKSASKAGAAGTQSQGGRSPASSKSRSRAPPAAIPVSSTGGDAGSGAASRPRKPALPSRRPPAKAGASAGSAASPSSRRASSVGQSRRLSNAESNADMDTKLPASAFEPKLGIDSYQESPESRRSHQISGRSGSLPDCPEHPEPTPSPMASHGPSDQEDNIKVCIRLRPLNATELKNHDKTVVTRSVTNANVIHLEQPANKSGHGQHERMSMTTSVRSTSHDQNTMQFDWVLNETVSQAEVYNHLGERLVQGVVDGFHGCVFAYGQTGSGKSHTIFGGSGEDCGLVPRICEGLFKFLQRDSEDNNPYIVRLSYLELYNEKARDLLKPDAEQDGKELEIRQHPRVGVFVDGLTSNVVTGIEDVMRLLQFGHKIRIVGCTNMNVVSSRSHAVVTMQVERTIPGDNGQKVKRRAQLHSVDLAGSERHSATHGHSEARVSESKNINKSLSALSLMISKLAHKHGSAAASSQHIPYRNSKLTYLLSDSLMGNCRTAMLACVSPAESSLTMTESTLRFACSVKSIRTQPVKNEEIEGDLVNVLRAEIESLRSMLKEGSNGDEDIREKLKISQTLAESFGTSIEELTAKSKALEHERVQALESLGLNTSALAQAWQMGDEDLAHKIASDAQPYLVNVCDDPLLSGCLTYTLPKGKEIQVGSDEACTVQIDGLGVQPQMCTLMALDEQTVEVRVASPQSMLAAQIAAQHDQSDSEASASAAIGGGGMKFSHSRTEASQSSRGSTMFPTRPRSVSVITESKNDLRRGSRRSSATGHESASKRMSSGFIGAKKEAPADSSDSEAETEVFTAERQFFPRRRGLMARGEDESTGTMSMPLMGRMGGGRSSFFARRASLFKSGVAEVFVNSERVIRSKQLQHGDRLRVGRTHVFQLFIPQAPDQIKSSVNEMASALHIENSGQQILVKEYAAHLQERIGIERASKVFHALQELQPLVEEANDLTEELRGGEDELVFKAHVLTDVLSVEEDPELTVALRRVAQFEEQDLNMLWKSPDQGPRASSTLLAVWSLPKFQQRLEVMRDLYHEVSDRDKPWGEADDADPWRDDRGAPLVGTDTVKASSRLGGESPHPEEPDAEPHDGEVRDIKMAARLSDLEQQLALAKNELAKRDEELAVRCVELPLVKKELEDLMTEREIGARAVEHLHKLQVRLGGAEERIASLQTQLGVGPNESISIATPASSAATDSPPKPTGVVAPAATSPPLVHRRSLSPAPVARSPNVVVHSPGHPGVSSRSPSAGARSLSPPRARTVTVGPLRSASGAAARSLSPDIAPRSLSPPMPMHAVARRRPSATVTPAPSAVMPMPAVDGAPLPGGIQTPLGERTRQASFPSLLPAVGPLLPPAPVPPTPLLMTKALRRSVSAPRQRQAQPATAAAALQPTRLDAEMGVQQLRRTLSQLQSDLPFQVGAPQMRRTMSDRQLQTIDMAQGEVCLTPEPASVTLKCTPGAASRSLHPIAPSVAMQPASTASALQFAPAMAPSLAGTPPPPDALQFQQAMAASLAPTPPPPLSLAVPVRDSMRLTEPHINGLQPSQALGLRHVQPKARARSEERGPAREVRAWQSEIHREMARLRQDIASLGRLCNELQVTG